MTGFGGMKVLIVEDEYLIAIEVEATLNDADFEVVGIAASADEAVALAGATRPDIVLMDIRLAGKRDGVDAALELYRVHNIRCLFATAHLDQAIRTRAQAALPLGWLAKPYQPDGLIAALKQALSPPRPD